MRDERKSSWVLRIGSLGLALAFLGFSMLRASTGCTKSAAPLEPETAEPKPSAPAAAAAPAPSSEVAEPVAAPMPAPTPSSSAAAPKPAGPKPGYFPGTKAAPMPWAQEKNPPPQQQAAPQK